MFEDIIKNLNLQETNILIGFANNHRRELLLAEEVTKKEKYYLVWDEKYSDLAKDEKGYWQDLVDEYITLKYYQSRLAIEEHEKAIDKIEKELNENPFET